MTKVYKVFYDDEGHPWDLVEPSLLDKVRYVRDWLRTPVLVYPNDFVGQVPR